MNFKFCPKCGSKLIEKSAGDDGMIPYCEKCNEYFFNIFPTCVIALVVNQYNEIVLLKQSYLSDKYMTFPAGYMTEGESAEEAIKREIKEEIGLDAERITYVVSKWFHLKNILMLGFFVKVKKSDFVLSSEVDEANWTSIEKVPKLLFPETPDNIARILYKKYIDDGI